MGFLDFFFSRKKRTIKYKVFESVEHAQSTIPLNKAILVEAGKTELCFVRTTLGLFALENKCPHELKPFHKGTCNSEHEIICPFHRHAIDLKTGQDKSHAGCGKTNVYEVTITEKGIYVEC